MTNDEHLCNSDLEIAGNPKKSWTLKLHVSKINTSLCLLFRDLELVSILSNTQNGPILIQMTNPSTISLLIYLYTCIWFFYIDINSYLLFIRYYFMSVELTFSDMDFIFLHVEFFGVISTKCEWMYITTE